MFYGETRYDLYLVSLFIWIKNNYPYKLQVIKEMLKFSISFSFPKLLQKKWYYNENDFQ